MNEQLTYLMSDGAYFKIGKSINPERRYKEIKTGNAKIRLICYGNGVNEKYMHDRFYTSRINGEWFKLNDEQLRNAIRLIKYGENNLYLNYDNTVQKMIEGSLKSDKLSEKYIIDFGKYKGTAIKDMTNEEQFKYCKWLYNQMREQMTKGEKKRSRKYKAFHWAIYKNTKQNI
jgi:hypothetical protein